MRGLQIVYAKDTTLANNNSCLSIVAYKLQRLEEYQEAAIVPPGVAISSDTIVNFLLHEILDKFTIIFQS